MMKRIAVYASLLAVLLAALSPLARTQEPANTDVRREVADLLSKVVDSTNKGDMTTLAELVSRKSGFTAIANGEIAKGHDELMKNANLLVGQQGKYSMSLGEMDVNQIKPGVVIATGPYAITVTGDTASVKGKGFVSFVVEKQDKFWRIVHMHRSLAEAEIK